MSRWCRQTREERSQQASGATLAEPGTWIPLLSTSRAHWRLRVADSLCNPESNRPKGKTDAGRHLPNQRRFVSSIHANGLLHPTLRMESVPQTNLQTPPKSRASRLAVIRIGVVQRWVRWVDGGVITTEVLAL